MSLLNYEYLQLNILYLSQRFVLSVHVYFSFMLYTVACLILLLYGFEIQLNKT